MKGSYLLQDSKSQESNKDTGERARNPPHPESQGCECTEDRAEVAATLFSLMLLLSHSSAG